jgi:hypothetical protein
MPDQMTDGCNYISDGQNCLAVNFVSRMSFTLCCFHIFIFLITLARNEMAA